MGWTIDTAKPRLDKLFKQLGRQYKLTHPQSPHETVRIEHSGTRLSVKIITDELLPLFPDFVYIELVPGVVFPPPTQPIDTERLTVGGEQK